MNILSQHVFMGTSVKSIARDKSGVGLKFLNTPALGKQGYGSDFCDPPQLGMVMMPTIPSDSPKKKTLFKSGHPHGSDRPSKEGPRKCPEKCVVSGRGVLRLASSCKLRLSTSFFFFDLGLNTSPSVMDRRLSWLGDSDIYKQHG